MMSVMWQLPRDILHSVYSEWLEWEDMSELDIACVENTDRDAWLSSLTDLRMTQTLFDENLITFYIWLYNRKIFWIENFWVTVPILQDFLNCHVDLKSSLCPVIHSIEIDIVLVVKDHNLSQVKKNLSIFFSHCHSLREVTIWADSDYSGEASVEMKEIILEVLEETLPENSLIMIDLIYAKQCPVALTTRLLRKHALSLQDLRLEVFHGMEVLTSTLIENKIHLKALDIYLFGETSHTMDIWLIPYLSSAGGGLETLKVTERLERISFNGLLSSLATSCPKLKRLDLDCLEPCSLDKVRHLYERCTHLQHVDISRTISTDEYEKSVSVNMVGHNEDWVVCLCYALRRTQYKKALIDLKEDYHPVENLKSMLEPYEICVTSFASKMPLIAFLQDLPRLNMLTLHCNRDNNDQYTDATIAAIIKHANSLTELEVVKPPQNLVSSEMVNELIRACQLLKRLKIPNCSVENLVAISKHPSLRNINLTMMNSVSQDMLDELLRNEEISWPLSLETGHIALRERLNYTVHSNDDRVDCLELTLRYAIYSSVHMNGEASLSSTE
eukprot:scaffold3849_cov264-Ochromonas_danica.AAC.9